ncbi:MAG: glycoside hydrolase family 127 protein [Cyclobacteriaceae bacterium]|nr:glycoside hydrolase family 127 protein [Cyclobacteriaceae bacterium]
MKKIYIMGYVLFAFWANAFSQSYVSEWKDPKMNVQPLPDIKAFAFNVGDIKLLPGPFTDAMNADVNYLLKIEPDRLLADFRTHAGLEAKGERYGGWESSGLAGHTLGHYLSALSLHYASTGDKEFLARANYIVDELDECQRARKSGYVGAIPKEDSLWLSVSQGHIQSRGFDLNGAWSPWYTVHKIIGGLLDAYLYTNNQKALQVSEGIATWSGDITKNLSDSLFQKMLITEYGGMNDALVNMYAITGNKKYLDLSYRFYDKVILDSLALAIDVLPGKHSNTQIPKVIGSARRYQLTGDKKDKAIADFFWETVTKHHSYATGGNSNYEYLGEPDKLNDKLSDNTMETCNTYNMLKLTRALFAINPSTELMDYYEKALYNHILASQNQATGMMTYFVSLRMGGKKEYSDEFNSFTCCVGTGMENHVKYGENIYYRGKDGSLYVNLFIPSVLNWKEKNIQIKQETGLPADDKTIFTISAKKPTVFAFRIRKPHWADNVQVSINGTAQKVVADAEGYIVLNRKWKNNDKIEVITPLHFYTESLPDNANRRAVFYGPVLLAGVLGNKEPEPSEVPVFVTSETDASKWLNPVTDHSLVFQSLSTVPSKDVELIPFYRTADEHYTVYWDVFTPDQWIEQQKMYEADKQKQQALQLMTVDNLRIGEMQPERDHEVIGEKTVVGDDHNRKWRMAEDGGYISFIMKTDPEQMNTLVCSYWGMDNRGRKFDIYADGILIATEDLNKYKASKFYEITYHVPAEITRDKTSVTIKLVPQKNNSAGPLYGAKMVKGDVSGLIDSN